MKLFYITNICALLVFLSTGTSCAQTLIQICSEPLSVGDCVVSTDTPDYKNVEFDYLIYRDQFVDDAPRLGKGVNSPASNAKIDLFLDVYVPCNNATNRPAILIPKANGYTSPVGKSKLIDDLSYRYYLQELAKKGFVVITYEYRVYTSITSPGFYADLSPLGGNGNTLDSCAYNAFLMGVGNDSNNYYRCHGCMIEAGEEDEADALFKLMMYMNKQDALAAAGYAVSDPNGIGLDIDADKIFIGGFSNGAQVAISNAYIDESDYEGGLAEGLITQYFGPLDTLAMASSFHQNHSFAGVLGFWGSIHDLNWIDSNDPPAMMIHGTWDDVVPFQSNFMSYFQFGDTSHFMTYGSEPLACKLIENNINVALLAVNLGSHGFLLQADHCTPDTVCGLIPSNILVDKTLQYLRSKVLWNINANTIQGVNPVPCPELTSPDPKNYLIETDLNGNCVSKASHMPYNITTLQKYCSCLSNPLNSEEGSQSQPRFYDQNKASVYPVPFDDLLHVLNVKAQDDISIFSMKGKKMDFKKNLENETSFRLNVSSFPAGMYLLRIGNQSKKIIKIN